MPYHLGNLYIVVDDLILSARRINDNRVIEEKGEEILRMISNIAY